jgi:cell migration-inducing and hyaluronan-binding protein
MAADFVSATRTRSLARPGGAGEIVNFWNRADIVIYNGVASHEGACKIRPSWGAAVCAGDMGRFSIAGNFIGFEICPITDPIILQCNRRRFEYIGETTIGSGAEVRVDTSRPTSSLSLREMNKGSWVIFELPRFTKTAAGKAEASLTALRAAHATAYFRDSDKLWVKLVVEDADHKGPVVEQVGRLTAQATIDVGR